jgi:replicative DNA helicase
MKVKGRKMERLSNLEIERGILAAIIFDGANFESIAAILKPKDFYLHFHQYLFEAMGVLNDKNYPIDEIMLREELTKHNKFDESLMLEVITMAPIEMIEAYATTIKELSSKRQLERLLNKGKIKLLDDNDTDTLAIIEELKQSLEDINKNTADIFKLVDFSEVEDKEIEFILEDFLPIPRKAVSLLSAKGGAGKSWLVLQLALRYINQNPTKKVFAWLSEDPTFATKKRAEKIVKDVLSSWKGMKDLNLNSPLYRNFRYLGSDTRPFHFVNPDDKNNKINSLFYKLKHTLKDFEFIILDPLIAFFGGDENSNSQAREFMNLLTEWADKEDKAILVVHHNNKNSNSSIRGASAFVDAVRLQYELKLYEDKDKEEGSTAITDNRRKINIIKDNWGVERIVGKKEIDISIFGNDLKVNVYESKPKNRIESKAKSQADEIESSIQGFFE